MVIYLNDQIAQSQLFEISVAKYKEIYAGLKKKKKDQLDKEEKEKEKDRLLEKEKEKIQPDKIENSKIVENSTFNNNIN